VNRRIPSRVIQVATMTEPIQGIDALEGPGQAGSKDSIRLSQNN
jgi:hypothetical protein